MNKLLLITLTLALGTQQIHAMHEDILLARLSMEGQEKTKSKKSAISAQDCACAAKACCFACAFCGLLTAPALAAPIRNQNNQWLRIPTMNVPLDATIREQHNGINNVDDVELYLPCFYNKKTSETFCTTTILETITWYNHNWPQDDRKNN